MSKWKAKTKAFIQYCHHWFGVTHVHKQTHPPTERLIWSLSYTEIKDDIIISLETLNKTKQNKTKQNKNPKSYPQNWSVPYLKIYWKHKNPYKKLKHC